MLKKIGLRLLAWKNSPWFVAAEIIGGVLAFAGLTISLVGLFQAISESEESRKVNAWAVLAATTPGNSGKVDAIGVGCI